MKDGFFEKTIGLALEDFAALAPDQRAATARDRVPDLHFFFDQGRPLAERDAPPRTLELAGSLYELLRPLERGDTLRSLVERIVTDGFLRSEADRDQNVYLGSLFTRRLTHAVPDLIFQPVSAAECQAALSWARERRVPVTLRAAATTAMGGAVPNEGGLALDLSRLDDFELDANAGVAVLGAGARLGDIHQRLAAAGHALAAYPSNLGGTLVGWFVTGGIGLNAFGRGRALDHVRAADVLLPQGEQVRFHDDGRLDVPAEGKQRRTLAAGEAEGWFAASGYPAIGLADLAGSEGTLGLVLQLAVSVEPRGELGAFLLSFAEARQALEAAAWIGREAGKAFATPANLKFFSGSHMHHVRAVWQDDDASPWRAERAPDPRMPWTRIAGPVELGATPAADHQHAGGYLLVDFLGLDGAREFARSLGACPGSPRVLGEESVRVAAERFKPQQTKRLGPGLLAAEIVLPAAEVAAFLPAAESLARAAGNQLDAEVYFLADGSALAIAAYLIDHRRGDFALDLLLAPALLDLALARHQGKPYVLGRWQSPYFAHKFGSAAARVRDARRRLDPGAVLNRGVRTGPRWMGVVGALAAATMVPGVSLLRLALGLPIGARLAGAARRALRSRPGPAAGRGEPLRPGQPAATPGSRAIHCVNCGECNSVCPIFHESKIRLPQMLTHLAEAASAGEAVPAAGSALLDLCMRCGNCEEVCQAGIPHLPIYRDLQQASDRAHPYDRERHLVVLAAVRGSARYRTDFLDIRPGAYAKRTPASLPGVGRYLLLRAENGAGPSSTCIHCGACVAVCPTAANHEFQGQDPRLITTDQERCIGCGTCVEVCPANHQNGGRTLRVMEAPTPGWYQAVAEFERVQSPDSEAARKGVPNPTVQPLH